MKIISLWAKFLSGSFVHLLWWLHMKAFWHKIESERKVCRISSPFARSWFICQFFKVVQYFCQCHRKVILCLFVFLYKLLYILQKSYLNWFEGSQHRKRKTRCKFKINFNIKGELVLNCYFRNTKFIVFPSGI